MTVAKKIETALYYERKVALVKDQIEKHLHAELNIKLLADFSCVSYHHLCDIFYRVERLPIKQYINQSRVRQASILLRTTNMTLNEIALHVGYMNKSSLSKAFRKKFKLSPGQYREASLQGEATTSMNYDATAVH
jgi:AraC-like DNA-binding protein